jgi:hypothetical protein
VFTKKESELKKNKNKQWEINLDLSKAKLMGADNDPDYSPYTGTGFFI